MGGGLSQKKFSTFVHFVHTYTHNTRRREGRQVGILLSTFNIFRLNLSSNSYSFSIHIQVGI